MIFLVHLCYWYLDSVTPILSLEKKENRKAKKHAVHSGSVKLNKTGNYTNITFDLL